MHLWCLNETNTQLQWEKKLLVIELHFWFLALFPPAGQQGASSLHFWAVSPLTSCPGCSRIRPFSWTWSLSECECVSLMAAFQAVSPNELIANGNWGLKCNWISRFLCFQWKEGVQREDRRGGGGRDDTPASSLALSLNTGLTTFF